MTTKLRVRFLSTVLAVVVSQSLWAADVGTLIHQGVSLHDDGDFQGAIKAFEKALEMEPENAVARHELSNTYFAKGDYKACVETAEAGIELDSDLAPKFYAIAASCYSEAGNEEKALELFRAGLAKSPDDTMLQFNIGVTLAGQGANDEALEHFERAAELSPDYASPYFFIGLLHHDADERVPGLFYLARFVTLAPDSARTVQASAGVFELFFAGQNVKPDHEIEVNVAISGDDDPFGTLEVSRSLAATTIHLSPEELDLKESDGELTEADRKVDALVSFFQMASELGDGSPLLKTTTWKQAIEPILSIHAKGSGKALGYLLAARAEIPGGRSWLEKHPEELAALGDVLNDSRP